MRVLSFAHLKQQNLHDEQRTALEVVYHGNTPVGGVRPSDSGPTATGKRVLSFAHLKATMKPEAPSAKASGSVLDDKSVPEVKMLPAADYPSRTTWRIPAVALSARVMAVDYCRGCSRFMPAEEWEKEKGNPYGRCQRDDQDGYEVWKIIPPTAIVKRCWYWIQEEKNKKGEK